MRRLNGVWRRSSFTTKFSLVVLVAGAVIAVVPLMLSEAATRTQAMDRAADKAAIAANLVQDQRRSLEVFAAAAARQVVAAGDAARPAAIASLLQRDASVNQNGDVLGTVTPPGVVTFAGGAGVDGDPAAAEAMRDAAADGLGIARSTAGGVWLFAGAHVAGGATTVFAARSIDATLVASIRRSLATALDPASLVLLSDTHRAVAGSIAGAQVAAGTALPSALAGLARSQAATVSLRSGDAAAATAPLGDGYSLLVTTPVQAFAAPWQPVLLLLALILVAMLFIVVVVQTSLQRPLRRLDRAVAGLGRGEFDLPVETGSDDELRRLGETFEAMRKRLRATIRATDARAAVATELSSAQPLETSLRRVCARLRVATECEAAMIVITASEMSDPFCVVDGEVHHDLDAMLSGEGPLGAGLRHAGPGALTVCATGASDEARLGLREFCVAPLRVGAHVHGVLAAAGSHGFLDTDVDLVAGTAEQVALALERYRFIAVVQRQASIDDLTGLHNHRFLVDYLGQQVALAERLGAPLAILMLDIDHFKVLNDTHGHPSGDTALAAFAQTLLSSVRRSDLAARYGGEEFAVVMANTNAQDARLVAEKIRAAVAGMAIELPDGTSLSLTVSIGAAAYPEDTDTAGELLALADEALYRAKRAGRDRTCTAAESRRGAVGRRATPAVMHTPRSMISEDAAIAGRRRPSQ